MRRIGLVLALFAATTGAAFAVPNRGVLYPDNSYHYAIGFPNVEFPTIFVQRGHSCTIVLEKGEQLVTKDNVPVVLDDRTRWSAVGSRAGGQRMGNMVVPVTWTILVQPANDADDAWLTINSAMGNRYMVHLVAVDRHSSLGEHLVGFYFYHQPHPARRVARRA